VKRHHFNEIMWSVGNVVNFWRMLLTL